MALKSNRDCALHASFCSSEIAKPPTLHAAKGAERNLIPARPLSVLRQHVGWITDRRRPATHDADFLIET